MANIRTEHDELTVSWPIDKIICIFFLLVMALNQRLAWSPNGTRSADLQRDECLFDSVD